jgi:GDP-L-fucose synthase
MPTNLYGVGDNFHAENSHVIPALIRRFHEAKINDDAEIVVWGSGKPKREFLYVDDMADASVYVLELDQGTYKKNTRPMLSHINVGTGEDCTIEQLALTIKDVVRYEGKIRFDSSKPDGAPRKLMDVSRLNNLGWKHRISLREGIEKTYFWYAQNPDNVLRH